MMNVSIALLASIYQSGFSSAASTAQFPSITPRLTISAFIKPEHLLESYSVIVKDDRYHRERRNLLQHDPEMRTATRKARALQPYRRKRDIATENMAMLWVLNFSDGAHSLLDIAERSKLSL